MSSLGGESPCAWRGEVIDSRGSELKRSCGREDDRPGLLQFSDADADIGSSTDGHNHREPELEPKHKIFLSHSGCQKDFTEQLCVDLERCQYYPFFDKRPDSLPKGRKFPALIIQAAQQCKVGVLILSEEFFTRTKWPMVELEAFVEAQKEDHEKIAILPVYLGLSRDECTKNAARHSHWVTVWREWAQSDKRIDIEKWKEALRVLGPSNGIEYVKSLGEVMLRKEIVDAVRHLVRPENTWSAGQIEGRTRICKAIIEKFAGTRPSSMYGVRVVGVHGIGGVGKTTLCKLLCDDLFTEYEGKVCHCELGTESPLALQKQVLRDVTDINHESLLNLTHDMTTNLLNRRIHQQQVFLALDNVWPESIEEAKVYFQARFCRGSIVMVAARSIDLLTRLHIDESDCMEMPELEEEDAKRLFLHHAACGVEFSSDYDEKDILYCVRQCKCRKGANMGEHFHPLALKVLGAELGRLGLDPKMWVENLVESDKFNDLGEREDPLFSVLRKGYDSLRKEDQLLFMDSVLFHPPRNYHRIGYVMGMCLKVYPIDIYKWLGIVHRTKVKQIMSRLQGLKEKSLLEDIGDGLHGVSIHDLYLEFAKMEVKRDDSFTRRWVWYDKEEVCLDVLIKTPPGYCWGNLERVFVGYNYNSLFNNFLEWRGTVEEIKWQHFSNVVVLQLFIDINQVLDLRGLRCLRSLHLEWKKFGGEDDNGKGKLDGLGELKNLGWLDLCNIHCAPCIEEIGYLTKLKVLWLNTNCGRCEREALSPSKLDKCIHLEELVLQWCGCFKAISDLSQLTSLRTIVLEECMSVNEVVGLNPQMHKMEELVLSECSSLRHVCGLDDLISLHKLHIEDCPKLQGICNLHKFTNLHKLSMKGAFSKVLGLSESMPLEELLMDDAVELRELHLLRNLQKVTLDSSYEAILPRFGKFIALEELNLLWLQELQNLPDMHELSRLQRLTIEWAPKLVLQLPVLGDLVALQELRLWKCGTSVGIAELPDLHRLTNLQVLDLISTPIKSLPSLKSLMQLRELNCVNTHVAELPDLIGLKVLESIEIAICDKLMHLGNIANLPALERIDLYRCHQLTSMGNLANLPALEQIFLYECHQLTSMGNLANLPALKLLDLKYCAMLESLPDLSGLKMLESITLSGCRELTSLDHLANLLALNYLDIRGCNRLERLPDFRSSMKVLHY